MGGSLARKIGHFPPRGAFSWTSLRCMNFQYPEFDRWCDQRPVAFWQRLGFEGRLARHQPHQGRYCWPCSRRALSDLRVRFKTCLRVTKLSQHEADGGKFQEREGVAVEIFPILGEPATTIEPCDGSFDDPTLG